MISYVTAVEFVRRAGTGRTKPAWLVCEDLAGEAVEVVAKLPVGCAEGVGSLAAEAIGACLAADLGLRVPQPYFVEISDLWLGSIHDTEWAAMARSGGRPIFGSTAITGGFTAWQNPSVMDDAFVAEVALAASFDFAVENSDRRPENQNCLKRGSTFYLIDHELCFPPMIIGRPKPWVAGGLQDFAPHGKQIFVDALRRRDIDWAPIVAKWKGLSDAQIDGYGAALPPQWIAGAGVAARAKAQIKAARDNIEGLVAEIGRVLT